MRRLTYYRHAWVAMHTRAALPVWLKSRVSKTEMPRPHGSGAWLLISDDRTVNYHGQISIHNGGNLIDINIQYNRWPVPSR